MEISIPERLAQSRLIERSIRNVTVKCMTWGFQFDEEAFQPVTKSNRFHTKPNGGLWGSPVETDRSWKDWCLAEDFRIEALSISMPWTFSGRACVVDRLEDTLGLPWYLPYPDCPFLRGIDFDELAKHADGFWLTAKGESETRFSEINSLYGYDCETLVAFNRDSILLE